MSTARIVLEVPEEVARRRPSTVPRRGLIVAMIAVGLGAYLAKPSDGGPIAWSDAAILASMAVVAMFGAAESRRLVASQMNQSELEPTIEVAGPWLTVMVNPGGPSDASGTIDEPKSPTRDDPERRSLTRRAEERVPIGVPRR